MLTCANRGRIILVRGRYSPAPISRIGEVGLSEPSSFSSGDGEGLGLDAFRHRVVHHDGVAVLVGLEDAGGNRRTLRRNDPQLVGLARRHSGSDCWP